jgi:hypothetical protein
MSTELYVSRYSSISLLLVSGAASRGSHIALQAVWCARLVDPVTMP